MTVEQTRYDGGTRRNKLTTCPFCGHEFDGNSGQQRTAHLMHCDEADAAREPQQ